MSWWSPTVCCWNVNITTERKGILQTYIFVGSMLGIIGICRYHSNLEPQNSSFIDFKFKQQFNRFRVFACPSFNEREESGIGPRWVVYQKKKCYQPIHDEPIQNCKSKRPNFTDSQKSTSSLCFEYQSDPPQEAVFSKEALSYDIRPLYTTSQTCGGLQSVAPSLTTYRHI